jgi:mRNA interferase MazF
MRPIHLVQLDTIRPALVLTRLLVVPYLTRVTVAPITGTMRGLTTEVPVDSHNGLDKDSVVSLDNVVTVEKTAVLRRIGFLLPAQEAALAAAIWAVYDLELPGSKR